MKLEIVEDYKRQYITNLANKIAWSGVTKTSSVYHFAEGLIRLGERTQDNEIAGLGRDLSRRLLLSSAMPRIDLTESYYSRALESEVFPAVHEELQDLHLLVVKQTVAVEENLKSFTENYPWLNQIKNSDEIFNQIGQYFSDWLKQLEKGGIVPLLAVELRSVAPHEFHQELERYHLQAKELESASNLQILLRKLEELLRIHDIHLKSDERIEFDNGHRLAAMLRNVETPQQALSVLIFIWKILDEETRREVLAERAPELYAYLKTKTPGELDCLARETCEDLTLVLAKKMKIFSEISKFGVYKIRDMIESHARAKLFEKIYDGALQSVRRIYVPILNKIFSQIDIKKKLIESIQGDETGYVQKQIHEWSSRLGIASGLFGAIVPSFVEISGLEINKINSSNKSVWTTGAEVLGAHWALSSHYFKSFSRPNTNDFTGFRALLIGIIHQLLALGGGAHNLHGQALPTYTVQFQGANEEKIKHLDIENFDSDDNLSSPYVAPDQIELKNTPSGPVPVRFGAQVSALAQAELLRGLSASVYLLQDWKKGVFDHLLGDLVAGDLFPSATEKNNTALQKKLFPKAQFFSLIMGHAAVLLLQLESAASPLVLMDLNGKFSWVGDNESSKVTSTMTQLGVADRVDGGKTHLPFVRSEAVSRWALTLLEYLDATQDLPQTTAAPLRKKNKQGQMLLEKIMAARLPIRKMLLGFSNALSSGLRETHELLSSQTQLPNLVRNREYRLVDQALAIQFLLHSSQLFQIPSYAHEATDIYFLMNQKLWRKELQFYSAVAGQTVMPSPEELVIVLSALYDLQRVLPPASQRQCQQILRIWLETLSVKRKDILSAQAHVS